MSQIRGQKRFTISEVAVDCHDTAPPNNWTPTHTAAPISHTRLSLRST